MKFPGQSFLDPGEEEDREAAEKQNELPRDAIGRFRLSPLPATT